MLHRHLYRFVAGIALLIAFIAAYTAYDPHDWLGLKNLFVPAFFVLAFCIAWPILAVSGLLIIRRVGVRIFRTATLWAGLTMFTPAAFILAELFVLEPERQRDAARQLSQLQSTLATGDLTSLHEPLSQVEYMAIEQYAFAPGRTLDQRLALVTRFPHSWGVFRTLVMLPDAQPELLQSIYDLTLHSRAARDVRPEPSTHDAVKAMGAAYCDTLNALRSVWQQIAYNPRAPAALLDVMARSPNPYARQSVVNRAMANRPAP